MRMTSDLFHASMKLGAAFLLLSSSVACGDDSGAGSPGAGLRMGLAAALPLLQQQLFSEKGE